MQTNEEKKVPMKSLKEKSDTDIYELVFQILEKMINKEEQQKSDPMETTTNPKVVDQKEDDQEMIQETGEEEEELQEKVSDDEPEIVVPPTMKIDALLKNTEINKANVNTLALAYHQFSIEQGTPFRLENIKLWPKSVLQEIIKSKRDLLVPQIKPKQIKNGNSILRQKNKYSGKKLTQTNLLKPGKTMYTCRYSLAFTIPASYKGTEGLRRYLIDIITEMISYADEGFCILQWDTDAITGKITEPDDLPIRITDLKKYFNGARSPESSVFMYAKIRPGFPITCDRMNFDADVQGWCKNRSIRFYVCSVQHPNVRSCGWLAYMPRTVNQETWCKAIKTLYNTMYNDNNNLIYILLAILKYT